MSIFFFDNNNKYTRALTVQNRMSIGVRPLLDYGARVYIYILYVYRVYIYIICVPRIARIYMYMYMYRCVYIYRCVSFATFWGACIYIYIYIYINVSCVLPLL